MVSVSNRVLDGSNEVFLTDPLLNREITIEAHSRREQIRFWTESMTEALPMLMVQWKTITMTLMMISPGRNSRWSRKLGT